jgi:hypothetical protein
MLSKAISRVGLFALMVGLMAIGARAAADTLVSGLTVVRVRIYDSGSVLVYFDRDVVSDGSCNASVSKNYVRILSSKPGMNGALSVAMAAKLSKKRVNVSFQPDDDGQCALRWLELAEEP